MGIDPPVRDQHLVSQALTRRWASGSLVHKLDLESGRWAHVGAAAFTKFPWFVPSEVSTRLERDIWKPVEDALTGVIEDLEAGADPNEPARADVIRTAAALHLVRSYHSIVAWNRMLETNGTVAELTAMASDPRVADVSFQIEHGGLRPAGPMGLLAGREAFLARVERELAPRSEVFARQLEKEYLEIRAFLTKLGIQLGVAPEANLLLGDAPAVTVDGIGRRVGIRAGVLVREAGCIAMPLSPRLVASFTHEQIGVFQLPPEKVAEVNTWQIAASTHAIVAPARFDAVVTERVQRLWRVAMLPPASST